MSNVWRVNLILQRSQKRFRVKPSECNGDLSVFIWIKKTKKALVMCPLGRHIGTVTYTKCLVCLVIDMFLPSPLSPTSPAHRLGITVNYLLFLQMFFPSSVSSTLSPSLHLSYTSHWHSPKVGSFPSSIQGLTFPCSEFYLDSFL